MKKLILLIIVIICLCASACNSNTPAQSETTTKTTTSETTTKQTTIKQTTTTESTTNETTSKPTTTKSTTGATTQEHAQMNEFYIKVNDKTLTADFEDNKSAEAFKELLQKGDVTVSMDDYGNFEKVGELGYTLPQSNKQITTSPGDVILYLGSNITIYYDVNSWNFTRLGKIKGMTRETMLDFFGGKGDVSVTFSLTK